MQDYLYLSSISQTTFKFYFCLQRLPSSPHPFFDHFMLSVWEENNFSSVLIGSNSWSNNQIDIRQANKRKANLILCKQRSHKDNESQGQGWHLKLICHSELRKEIQACGFIGEENDSQNKNSRCLPIKYLSCHTDSHFSQIKSYLSVPGPPT